MMIGKTVLKTGTRCYLVPPFFMYQLLLFSFVVLALSIEVFISSYLFIKSYGCSTEPYVHCFEAKAHFLVIGTEELDCTDSMALENVTSIICYDLTLNIRRAVVEGGALMVSSAAYFYIVTSLLLTLNNLKKSCIWKGIILAIQISIMLLGLCLVYARVIALAVDEDTIYEDFIYLIVYTYVVIIGGIVPWWKFKRMPE